jgi:hypothetical protein
MPALPSATSLRSCWKPSRAAAGTGLAEIAIDHMNALDRPARGNRAVAQRVLALCALAVFGDLPQRGLANIQVRITLEVVGRDLEFRHARAP